MELIATSTTDLVRNVDLLALQKLQLEFATELATLRSRVDAVEASTDQLEQQHFSTTTKFNAEAVFAVANVFGQDSDKNNTVLQERAYLNICIRHPSGSAVAYGGNEHDRAASPSLLQLL